MQRALEIPICNIISRQEQEPAIDCLLDEEIDQLKSLIPHVGQDEIEAIQQDIDICEAAKSDYELYGSFICSIIDVELAWIDHYRATHQDNKGIDSDITMLSMLRENVNINKLM